MRKVRLLTSADRPAVRARRFVALTVRPDEFMMTDEEGVAASRANCWNISWLLPPAPYTLDDRDWDLLLMTRKLP